MIWQPHNNSSDYKKGLIKCLETFLYIIIHRFYTNFQFCGKLVSNNLINIIFQSIIMVLRILHAMDRKKNNW